VQELEESDAARDRQGKEVTALRQEVSALRLQQEEMAAVMREARSELSEVKARTRGLPEAVEEGASAVASLRAETQVLRSSMSTVSDFVQRVGDDVAVHAESITRMYVAPHVVCASDWCDGVCMWCGVVCKPGWVCGAAQRN
jgi:chromosome segregation ATPase